MFMELAQLAIHNLLRARARLMMTSGGVLVGTSAVIILIALTIGLQSAAEAGMGDSATLTRLDIYPNWSPDPNSPAPKLSHEAVIAFSRVEGVRAVIPFLSLDAGARLKAGKLENYSSAMSVDPRLFPYLALPTLNGTTTLNPGEVFIGEDLLNNFYNPQSDTYEPQSIDYTTTPIKLIVNDNQGGERSVTLNIADVIPTGTEYAYSLLMPLADMIQWREWASGTPLDPKTFEYSQVIVQATGRETVEQVAEAIRDMGYNASGMFDFLKQINSFFTTMRLMLGGVGGIALLVAAFGVANTMTMAILERTREIGLMKAVGATDGNILTIFLVEAGLVGFFGGLAGIAVSLGLQQLINDAIKNAPQGDGGGMMFLPVDINNLKDGLVVIPPELLLFGIALATSVGLIAGLYPSLRAARMTTVTALKTD